MALNLTEKENGKVLEIEVSGKVVGEDYRQLVPAFEGLVARYGKLRILFDMVDFHGWNAGALWQDLKFDVKHFNDIERLAMVGDKKWQKAMSVVCRPFTTAKIRYFSREEFDSARSWLREE